MVGSYFLAELGQLKEYEAYEFDEVDDRNLTMAKKSRGEKEKKR